MEEGAFIDRIERLSGVSLDGLALDGGAYSVFSATAGLRWTVATSGPAALYLTGATGLFYETVGDLDAEVRAEGQQVVEASASGDDVSYGLSLGAGVRVPVTPGVGFFVEPRFVQVFSETRYVPLRVGLSFRNLFDGGLRSSLQGRGGEVGDVFGAAHYELRAAYERMFLSKGDVGGQHLRATLSRHGLTGRTGLALGLDYRRSVHSRISLGSWSDRQGLAADLLFFVDALRFATGTTGHRLRVGIGPSLRHQWGEWPRLLLVSRPGDRVDVATVLQSYDRVYGKRLDEGTQGQTYYLFTDAFEETEWGGVLHLQYDLLFDRLVAGPAAGFWRYNNENLFSYGLHVGMRF